MYIDSVVLWFYVAIVRRGRCFALLFDFVLIVSFVVLTCLLGCVDICGVFC